MCGLVYGCSSDAAEATPTSEPAAVLENPTAAPTATSSPIPEPSAPHLGNIGTAAAERIEGKSAAQYIYESILDPNAFIAPVCVNDQPCPDPSIMPMDFGQRLSQQDLADIITYLLQQNSG